MAPRPFVKRPKTIPPVRPNIGIEMAYRRRLQRELEKMHRSLMRWVVASYRANEPLTVAQDARQPVHELVRSMRTLGKRWLSRFDELAPEMAEHFTKAASDRSDRALAAMLRKGGMSVKFQTTPVIRDVMAASVSENVGLIKTIAQQHLARVEGAVMRSAQVGRDVGALAKELSEGYGISERRAAFIAKDQSNKMTAVVNKTRQLEIGITKAIWVHSGGGREPRPEHVAFSNKIYDVAKGAFLEGEWVWPGTAINCRCVCRSIIPGL